MAGSTWVPRSAISGILTGVPIVENERGEVLLNRADLDFRVLFLAPTRRDGVVASSGARERRHHGASPARAPKS